MDAREVALLTLNACHRQGGWSDQILKKQLAAAGLRNKEIAEALFISEETVKSHIRSIFNKTNIDRRGRLVELLK